MNTVADYLQLLERSYRLSNEYFCDKRVMGREDKSRLEYLGEDIFDFTTYDGKVSEIFATKALEVCEALSVGSTFDYLSISREHYHWYLALCNMPFFADRIEWGSSIRAAWWVYHKKMKLTSFSLFNEEGQQIHVDEPMIFEKGEWENFIDALLLFARAEPTTAEVDHVPVA